MADAYSSGLQGLPRSLVPWRQRARSFGLTTSLDTNYDPSEQWIGFEYLLDETDVFLPNETEICSLTGSDTAEQATAFLAKKVGTLAVKLGSRGALGVQQGEKVETASIPINVVDTVGAGDSFDAGFLFGYLHGWTFQKSMRLAAVCGALSTRAAGGTTAQATLDEALPFLEM